MASNTRRAISGKFSKITSHTLAGPSRVEKTLDTNSSGLREATLGRSTAYLRTRGL